jgi:hypothetical protein
MGFITGAFREKPFHVGNFQRELKALRSNTETLHAYYLSRVSSGDLPPLRTFRQTSEEGARILNETQYIRWINRATPSDYPIKRSGDYPRTYSAIVSLDFNTGRLYAGFTDINFLKEDFPWKNHREAHKRTFDNWLSQIQKEYGECFFVRNAKGECLTYGSDTVLTFVATLASNDIEYIKRKNGQ